MSNINQKPLKNSIQINGTGLFSKDEVVVSISNIKDQDGIVFVLNDQKIPAKITNVSHTTRNIVLTNGNENLCLVEHFLATCSLCGINNIEVRTNKQELIFGDGSAIHWYELFKKSNLRSKIIPKYNLIKPLLLKNDDKVIAALPHDGFKASYFMDWDHPALGKLYAAWDINQDPMMLIKARSFATKEENDFFNATDRLLTLTTNGFNKKLYDPLEPVYHKILDIIGDLRLTGINPLAINMHVFGYKSGHALNIELTKKILNLIQ